MAALPIAANGSLAAMRAWSLAEGDVTMCLAEDPREQGLAVGGGASRMDVSTSVGARIPDPVRRRSQTITKAAWTALGEHAGHEREVSTIRVLRGRSRDPRARPW